MKAKRLRAAKNIAPAISFTTESTGRRGSNAGQQYAALPYRLVGDGLQVLLITSRETKRWVIPKGWPMKGKKPHAAAAREALEEAGLTGDIGKLPLGRYHYLKRGRRGRTMDCAVDVFLLRVLRQRRRWPERRERTVQWFGVAEAAASVREPELRELIANLEPLVSQSKWHAQISARRGG